MHTARFFAGETDDRLERTAQAVAHRKVDQMLKKSGLLQISGTWAAGLEGDLPHGLAFAAACFGAGFMASRALVFGDLAPFGIAAVTAAKKKALPFILLGAVFGTVLPHGPAYPIRYIAAMGAALVFRLLCAGMGGRSAVYAPACAAAASGLTGAAVVLANGMQTHDAALCFAEMILCGCSAYFFEKAAPFLSQPSKLWGLRRRDLVSVLISFCVLLLALQPLAVHGISLGRIAGVLAILIAARFGGAGAGCAAGASMGLVLGLGGQDMAPVLAGYGFGGLIAGFFAPLGRFGCALAFVLANAAAGANMGGSSQVTADIVEVIAASVLFLLLPDKLLCRLSALFVAADERVSSKNTARSRLMEASQALRDVADTISRVGERLATMRSDDTLQHVFDEASDRACHRCGMRAYCWNTAYNDTMDAMNHLGVALRASGTATRKDVPKHFSGRCCRLGELLEAINRCYSEYTARNAARRQINGLRRMLSEQWNVIASFLSELGESAVTKQVDLAPEPVRAAFATCGLAAEQAACRLDEKGHMSVEARVSTYPKSPINRTELAAELSVACGRRLDGPKVSLSGRETVLRFRQKALYQIEYGQYSIRKSGEKLCGDAAFAFEENGRAVLLLSDGMGVGGSAAVDANLAVDLISRLLRAGFGFSAALRAVNSALMLKSEDESFATLDIAAVDLYAGAVELFKAGAPPTYLRRRGRAERIVQHSLPVGILENTGFAHSDIRLGHDDLLVLVSDGAAVGDDVWLMRAITQFEGGSMTVFARDLALMAKRHRDDGHDDDITVLAARLEQA